MASSKETIDELVLEVGIEDGKYVSSARRVVQETEKLKRNMGGASDSAASLSKVLSDLGAAMGSIAIVGAFVKLAKTSITVTENVTKMHNALRTLSFGTRASAQDLLTWANAANRLGVSAESVQSAIAGIGEAQRGARFGRNTAEREFAARFGLNLAVGSPDQQARKIAELYEHANPRQREAMQEFGAGTAFAPILQMADRAIKEHKTFASVLAEAKKTTPKLSDAATDLVNAAKAQMDAAKMSRDIVTQKGLAPVFEESVKPYEEVQEQLGKFTDALADGTLKIIKWFNALDQGTQKFTALGVAMALLLGPVTLMRAGFMALTALLPGAAARGAGAAGVAAAAEAGASTLGVSAAGLAAALYSGRAEAPGMDLNAQEAAYKAKVNTRYNALRNAELQKVQANQAAREAAEARAGYTGMRGALLHLSESVSGPRAIPGRPAVYTPISDAALFMQAKKDVGAFVPQQPGAPGAGGAATPIEAQLMSQLTSRGLSTTAAAGVTANIIGESGGNPAAINPSGGAEGLFQWTGTRLAEFRRRMGKSPSQASVQEQIAYAMSEPEFAAAMPGLAGASTGAQANRAFLQTFEKPSAADQAARLAKFNPVANRLAAGSAQTDTTRTQDITLNQTFSVNGAQDPNQTALAVRNITRQNVESFLRDGRL